MNPIVLLTGGKLSIIGLILYLLFLIIFVGIIFLVTLMDFADKKSSKEKKGQIILSIFLFFFMSSFLVPPFFEFSKIEILNDSTWKLKNPWNITVGTIPPTTPRDIQNVDITMFLSTRIVNAESINIVTENKTYRSDGGDYKVYDRLVNEAEKTKTLTPMKKSDYYKNINIFRYSLLGLMLLIGFLFWRKK